jgi:hypothetical protein
MRRKLVALGPPRSVRKRLLICHSEERLKFSRCGKRSAKVEALAPV